MSEEAKDDLGPEMHPRGTLAIVAVYGVLFVIGWLVFYFVLFRGRGPVH
jgi:hypothetical protein